jgi:CSLREA domain-containing protein
MKHQCLRSLLTVFAISQSFLSAAVFVVNSNGDAADAHVGDGICATSSGDCTLRAALQEANALGGSNTIQFSVGSGLQTIIPTSALPASTSPIVIDATTQPGYAGTPLIELSGASAKGQTNGLDIAGGNSVVAGFIVNGFPASGIRLRGPGGNVVRACWVGTDSSGTLAVANKSDGILIDSSPNNLIGGTTTSDLNVVSGNNGLGGIHINGVAASANVIQGNYIGTNAAGNAAIPNFGRGVAVQNAPNNLIGGTVPGSRNLISGNRASGVRVFGGSATNNVIQGNYVGTDSTGQKFVPNSRGLQSRSTGTLIGGPAPEAANTVAGNGIDGIALTNEGSNMVVQGNVIYGNGRGIGVYYGGNAGFVFTGNSIYSNRMLGIDWNVDGVTPNDAGDLDTYLQNFPVLTAAQTNGTSVTLTGTLNSTPSNTFTLEFFANRACDPSGNGEGQRYLGQTVVTSDASGAASFSLTLPTRVATGQFATATATQATDGTSEFSACVAFTL